MPDNNYNIIKPVDGLQSLTGVNPVGQRRRRQRRENPGSHNDSGETPTEEDTEQQENKEDDKFSRHRIDFKA
jgi:hypothetical protein